MGTLIAVIVVGLIMMFSDSYLSWFVSFMIEWLKFAFVASVVAVIIWKYYWKWNCKRREQ